MKASERGRFLAFQNDREKDLRVFRVKRGERVERGNSSDRAIRRVFGRKGRSFAPYPRKGASYRTDIIPKWRMRLGPRAAHLPIRKRCE